MLREVVGARELLAAFSAAERLVLRVKRSEVTLQMFLTTEATSAEMADEGLGWVLRERLFSAPTDDGCGCDDGLGVLMMVV